MVGGDKLVEDRVVILEEAVEGVVIPLSTEVDGADEIDLDGSPAPRCPGRDFSLPVVNDRRVERHRPPLGVAGETEELDRIGLRVVPFGHGIPPRRLRGSREDAPPSPNHRDDEPAAAAGGAGPKILGPHKTAPVVRDLVAGPHRSSPWKRRESAENGRSPGPRGAVP